MSESRLAVTSELYDEYSIRNNSLDNNSCAKLTVTFLDGAILTNGGEALQVDDDGDLILDRLPIQNLTLDVSLSTQLTGVGLQLWRGALLLSDFLIHNKDRYLEGKSLLELGTGVGLTSIVASMYARKVIATDIDRDGILERIRSNFKLNSKFVKSKISVLPLDFFCTDWPSPLSDEIKQAQIIIAGDVIYDNDLTEAFIETLTKILMISNKTVFIALEKRYVFTIEDLDTVAPCYEHFLQHLKTAWNKPPMSQWDIKSIEVDFPQYLNYKRNKHLTLWQIDS